MGDTTITPAILSFTLLNLSNKFVVNYAQTNNCFLLYDGNHRSKTNIINNFIGYDVVKGVNLYYIPDIYKTFLYDYVKLDKTVLDITISTITESLLSDISSQINNDQVRVISMWLNKYEFVLVFHIRCDYISDINVTLDSSATDYKFIQDYMIKKIQLNEYSYAFKLYQRFK